MSSLHLLTTTSWVQDYGFRKALATDPGTQTFAGQVVGPGRRDVVAYWQAEKAHYPLWELLCYMGRHTVPQTLAYFDLPADTVEFVRWVYNHVAHEERERLPEFTSMQGQMNHFPYAALHAIWQRETDGQRVARKGNVLVYLDRITDSDGRELVRLRAPDLYE